MRRLSIFLGPLSLWALLLLASGLATPLFAAPDASDGGAVAPPEPDLSGVEAPVAALIAERRAAVLENPDSSQAWGRLGMAFDVHDLDASAARCYRRALSLAAASESESELESESGPGADESSFRWAYYLAMVIAGDGDPEALAAFERALALRPRYGPLRVRQGDLLLERGQLEAAEESYRAAIDIDGEGLGHAFLGLARIDAARGDLDSALAWVRQALAADPGNGEALGLMAEIHRRRGEVEAAAAARREAEEAMGPSVLVDPEVAALMEEGVSSYWHHRRGRFLLAAGRAEKAEVEIRAALELLPHAVFFESLARALLAQDRLAEAEQALRAGLVEAPDLASSHLLLGRLLARQGRRREAIDALRRAADLRPDRDVGRDLGRLLLEEGEKAEGIRRLRESLEHDEDPRTLLAVAFFLAATPEEDLRDAVAAEGYVRRLLELTGEERPEPFDVLGVTLAAQGRFEEAVAAAERALELAHGRGSPLVRRMHERLQLYRAGRAFVAED